MFGSFHSIIPNTIIKPQRPPEDIPPPTPIDFPKYESLTDDHDDDSSHPSTTTSNPLTKVLQSIIRPQDVSLAHLQALNLHINTDCPASTIIPCAAFIPDFSSWDSLTPDEAHALNEATRIPLNNDQLSPGCLVYLDRKRELTIANEAAFKAVRRIQPAAGQTQAKLGNSYEFYRCLEMFAGYWDDTSRPIYPPSTTTKPAPSDNKSPTPDGDPAPSSSEEPPPTTYRTSPGTSMPPEYRQNMLSAFLKLVAYDFACNVSAPRTEPRLHLSSPSVASYFTSGCTFVFRTPRERDAARAGIVQGPLAAVSARHSTCFTAERDAAMDLARELIAALLTAQHRRREGREEVRVGEGKWWCSVPRWGGGSGGPIGREVDMLSAGRDVVGGGDKDAPPPVPPSPTPTTSKIPGPPKPGGGVVVEAAPIAGRLAGPYPVRHPGPSISPEKYPAKRLKTTDGSKKTTLPMYDNYRMVRPPSATWDRKTRYEAIGRVRGKDWDDVFVVSSLFHHVSVLRVRVPDRLLEVLEGAQETDWGRLEVWRSRWFDFFLVEERLEAMRLVWGMMAFLMRREEEKGDAEMKDA